MIKQSAFINEESDEKIVEENEEEKLKELKRKELKRKSDCERQRAYYYRQKELKKNEKKIKKTVPKSNAERQREFRQRNAEKLKRQNLDSNEENVMQCSAVENIENVMLQEDQFHSQQLQIYEQRNECITPEVILQMNTGIPGDDPTEEDFEEDIGQEERAYYRDKFSDLNIVKSMRLHCSACDRHLGSSTRNESRMRAHPMLRTLVCHTCHTFYNSGEFEKGDDGSELYCRWCGQGGQVYCCSNCPHVFCAKCIKRNLGMQKIKEIENMDDWKCFKCNPRCLWDLRAVCWALLRYCDLKNKITYKTEDPLLKEAYQKDCATDHTDCCRHRTSRKKDKPETVKKKDKEDIKKTSSVTATVTKIPSAIQVKKFASINLDEQPKEKKTQKRPAASDNKVVYIKNPIAIAPNLMNPVAIPPAKKPRMPVVNPIRFAHHERKQNLNTYARIRPKVPTMPIPILPTQYNGFNINNNSFHNFANMVPNDTLNLSLESLTQGLDMVAVAMNSGIQDDDVVCTPDFPLEPLCEVTEENTDDDVQCITPGPVNAPKQTQPLISRLETALPDLNSDNIIQMTDNDVTVNAVTGGLKFRVDPQTLSSNKMYRLPDGRIFAIKANPNMPGGYSATIVAVAETGQNKSASKGATYAAKLSAVSSIQTSTPAKTNRSLVSNVVTNSKRNTPKGTKVTRGTDTSTRECDLQVPVEWYRFNLIEACDALEYSLQRLHKLKKEATCRYLRTRTVDEMKSLHKTLDRVLNTSATRFNEIKENLNKELKQYVIKKAGGLLSDEDDDDVEILPDEGNDDPIYIDENSVESSCNDLTCNENPEVDLTGVGNSDHYDSAELISDNVKKSNDDHNNTPEDILIEDNPKNTSEDVSNEDKPKSTPEDISNEDKPKNTIISPNATSDSLDNSKDDIDNGGNLNTNSDQPKEVFSEINEQESLLKQNGKNVEIDENSSEDKISEKTTDKTEIKELQTQVKEEKINGNTDKEKKDSDVNENEKTKLEEKTTLSDDNCNQDNDVKLEDTEMSEEMIETLLKDDNTNDADLKNKTVDVMETT